MRDLSSFVARIQPWIELMAEGGADEGARLAAAEEVLAELELPEAGTDADDPVAGAFFLLRMAARSIRRAHAPLPALAPARVARLEAALRGRPARDDAHGQLHIDLESTLRRADAVRELAAGGPILAVGDDDAVTVALALEGLTGLAAVDIDARLLAFLAGHGVETHEVDVLGSSVPASLVRRFAAVVTDPFRDLDGGLGFLTFGAACLRREAPCCLAWVDHPDWNFEHGEVRASMEALGFAVTEVREDLHAYPVPDEIADPEGVARALGLPVEPLVALTARTVAWSHLLVLRRAGG